MWFDARVTKPPSPRISVQVSRARSSHNTVSAGMRCTVYTVQNKLDHPRADQASCLCTSCANSLSLLRRYAGLGNIARVGHTLCT